MSILDQQLDKLFTLSSQLKSLRYTGTGVGQTIATGFNPVIVVITKFATVNDVLPITSKMMVSFSAMQGVTQDVASQTLLSDAVLGMDFNGIVLGTNLNVNSENVEYFAFLLY
jgi:hypothetical protein